MNLLFRIIIFFLIIPFVVHGTHLNNPDKSRESMIYEQSLSEIFDGKHLYIDYKFGQYSMLEVYDEEHNTAVLFLHWQLKAICVVKITHCDSYGVC